MDAVTTVCVIGGVIIAVVVFFAFRNRTDASKMLEQNVDVMPLMMQKATQMKITSLQQATKDDPDTNAKLVKIVGDFKANKLSIREYNDKLDKMIYDLDVEL